MRRLLWRPRVQARGRAADQELKDVAAEPISPVWT